MKVPDDFEILEDTGEVALDENGSRLLRFPIVPAESEAGDLFNLFITCFSDSHAQTAQHAHRNLLLVLEVLEKRCPWIKKLLQMSDGAVSIFQLRIYFSFSSSLLSPPCLLSASSLFFEPLSATHDFVTPLLFFFPEHV